MDEIRGVTWNHPRGIGPVRAAAASWASEPGQRPIVWEARSLADFEDAPIARLAEQYDIIAIDHPHIGRAVLEGAIAPIPDASDPALDGSGDQYVGLSLQSYRWGGRLWALPVDAATMVSASTDAATPETWSQVLELARVQPRGTVALAANPTHLLLTVLSVCDAVGPADPRQQDGRPAWWSETIDADRLERGVAIVQELRSHLPAWCDSADPIRVLDAMSDRGGPDYTPLVFGYSPYAVRRSDRRQLVFGTAPRLGRESNGTVLGGVGFAVSARRGDTSDAMAIARRLSSGLVQRTLIPQAGGQPAHREAWADPLTDYEFGHFYTRTLETVERSFLRPRTPGSPEFQRAAALRLHAAMLEELSARDCADTVRQEWERRAN